MKNKSKNYVCMFQGEDGFMYHHYFSTFKKAKKFMKKQITKCTENESYILVIDAGIYRVLCVYKDGQRVFMKKWDNL